MPQNIIWVGTNRSALHGSGSQGDVVYMKSADCVFALSCQQLIQNALALAAIRTLRHNHITPILKSKLAKNARANPLQSVVIRLQFVNSCNAPSPPTVLGAIHLWRPQKNHVFDLRSPLSTCVHMGRTPFPHLDVHTRSTWNTRRSLEMASTMTYTGPKAEIRLYDSNLFKQYF